MSDRNALDLQAEERLDLAEVALACDAAGLYAAASARGILVAIPNRRKRCRWKGTREHGYLLLILRDAVRSVLPGSYCIPIPDFQEDEYGPLRIVFGDASGRHTPFLEIDGRRVLGLPRWLPGATETECWARALVALFRAGLLPVVTER